MKNDDHIVIDKNKDLKNKICEECKKEDESVKQNLIMYGFKLEIWFWINYNFYKFCNRA